MCSNNFFTFHQTQLFLYKMPYSSLLLVTIWLMIFSQTKQLLIFSMKRKFRVNFVQCINLHTEISRSVADVMWLISSLNALLLVKDLLIRQKEQYLKCVQFSNHVKCKP